MRVISAKQIRSAKLKWPHSASALDEWYRKVKVLNPEEFAALKSIFPQWIRWGRYRMQRLYIRHVLDHREYDKGKWKE
ncbi:MULTISPECIES: type II toxin-antitoxin system HigB family toxin [unclassified Pseudomonas]|uniref:type II toxin-antitoxin system HigB family toxin n=1 Tax=unclassified Pseudomonas TaxID=196821 RepID=UPI00081BEB5C|nr:MULTISPECIES: type II toxin-antitoxin system HigB family toxin [unclassified Pseudomonas]MCP1466869.1 mRNA interferase HigB [Pseudomonas sp. S3E17]OCW21431.1 hypothetical protein BB029_22385 [Pseudomonas sp. S3E12]